MINLSLQVFCDRIVAAGRITADDVQALTRHVLPEGLTSRDEADMLIALDRVVAATDTAFGDYLVTAVVDFAVWGERPTGYIDAEIARWLVASLRNGSGPSRPRRPDRPRGRPRGPGQRRGPDRLRARRQPPHRGGHRAADAARRLSAGVARTTATLSSHQVYKIRLCNARSDHRTAPVKTPESLRSISFP